MKINLLISIVIVNNQKPVITSIFGLIINYYTRSALLSDVNFQVVDVSIKCKFVDVLNDC